MNRVTLVIFGFAKSLSVLLVALLLIRCNTIDLETGFEQQAAIHQQILAQTEDNFPDIDPLYLSDEIKALVDAQFEDFDSEEEKVHKIQRLLFHPEYLNLQYTDQRTHTALEAFELLEGNCLSATNLFIAMARYAGIDAKFQGVEVQPSWDKKGGFLVLSKHINASGRFNVQRRYVVDFAPDIALQQLTAAIVTDRQARALFFNNLGTESMIAGNLVDALAYIKNALHLDPDLSIAWNNIGAVYRRMGNTTFAEYSFQMAFSTDSNNATSINNLANFYRESGNERLARQYALAIERFNDKNPYFHFAKGRAAYDAQDLELAEMLFGNALRLKREEPDFYFALARVYDDLGEPDKAQVLTQSALSLLVNNQEIYQPSNQKLRILETSRILRQDPPGVSVRFN